MNESIGAGALALRVLAVAFLVVVNGFFVAAEFALVSSRHSKLDQLAEAGSVAARIVRSMQGPRIARIEPTRI